MSILLQELKLLHRSNSYKELAQHVGVAPNTVRRWLTDRSKPSKLASRQLLKALRRLTQVDLGTQELTSHASSRSNPKDAPRVNQTMQELT